MKVLLVTVYSLKGGGLSTHIIDMRESLRSEGCQVELIDYSQIEISKALKLWHFVGKLGNPHLVRKAIVESRIKSIARVINKLCTADSFDIIHAHDPIASTAVHSASEAKNIPLLQTIHGPLTFESEMTLGWNRESSPYISYLWNLEKTSFNKATRIYAVDTSRLNLLQENFAISPDKVDIVYNAVNCEEAEKIVNTPLSYEVPEKFILFPRRLVKKAGADVAIKAFKQAVGDSGHYLCIAGKGPEEEELKKLVHELELTDQVKFLGWQTREDTLKLTQKSSIVLVPSRPSQGVVEATAISAIEAMVLGKCVIVSAIGGLDEIVDSGQNGLSVPPDNPAALADALSLAINNDEKRSKMGENAYNFAREQLDTKVWIKKVLAVYKKTIESKMSEQSE